MIDLSKKKSEIRNEKFEPEEIAMAVFAIAIWGWIIIGIMGSL